MNDKETGDEAFTIQINSDGTISATPPIAGANSCWLEYRNGRLCYCCQTFQGIRCYCPNVTIDGSPSPLGFFPLKVAIGLFIVVIIGAILTGIGVSASPPPPWLVSWTTWIGAVIGIVAGFRILWIGGDALRTFVASRSR